VNLGCGGVAPPDWINVDYAIGARLRKIPVIGKISQRFLRCDWNPSIVLHDLRTRFPWADASVDYVYSSHSLEHLTRKAGEAFIHETFRVLRVGGIVRIVVPDLRRAVERYQAGEYDARDFLSALNTVDTRDAPVIKRVYSMLSGQGHRCMYDEAGLTDLMTAAGFSVARRAPFDSDIPGIVDIEGGPQTVDALIVEGRKQGA
jgi:predicted SAM-dependent methyltransferase